MAQITNIGIVIRIKTRKVIVQIEPQPSCKQDGYPQDCVPQIIEIHTDKAKTFALGEKVTVYMDNPQPWKTVFYIIILPLLLILSTVLANILWGMHAITAILYGFLALIPYYLVLYLYKVWIRDKIKFGLKKME